MLGRRGYQGPRALPKHGVHHYGFFLFALDEAIPEDTPLPSLDAAIELARGRVIARGHLTGTQEA